MIRIYCQWIYRRKYIPVDYTLTMPLRLLSLFLVLITCAYVLGLSIVNVVDRRLQDISLNMPNVYIQSPTSSTSSSSPSPFTYRIQSPKENIQVIPKKKNEKMTSHEGFQNVPRSLQQETTPVANVRPRPPIEAETSMVRAQLHSTSRPVSKPIPSLPPSPSHSVSLPLSNPASIHSHSTPSPISSSSKTYYLPLERMTPRQQQKFKHHAKLTWMTLGDYINWLLMYRNEPFSLPHPIFQTHLSQLEKNGTLQPSDLDEAKRKVGISSMKTIESNPYPHNMEELFPILPVDEYNQSKKHLSPTTPEVSSSSFSPQEQKEMIEFVRPTLSYHSQE